MAHAIDACPCDQARLQSIRYVIDSCRGMFGWRISPKTLIFFYAGYRRYSGAPCCSTFPYLAHRDTAMTAAADSSASLPTASDVASPLRFAVMGAGAVGCYFGALLARAGHAVTLIGRPAHVLAVRDNGLRLQTAAMDVQVPLAASTEPSAVHGADVVLFCVKSSDSEDAAQQIRPHLAPGALVLTLQNGVDNDERVRAVLDASTPVAAAVVYVATAMGGPGHVVHHGRGELVIAPSPRSDEVARQLTAAGIPTQVSDNVRGALWAKLVLNSAYNALSAL